MLLYLVRHGLANWPSWPRPDGERPLTQAGSQEIQALGAALAQREVKPQHILHSPLARAFETAVLLAEGLALAEAPKEYWALRPGFSANDLSILLRTQIGAESLMLVGHNPDMAELIHHLTGAIAQVREGTVASIKLDPAGTPLQGQLLWLVNPTILRIP